MNVTKVDRPLKDISTAELKLELRLREGPTWKCHKCGNYCSGSGNWACPSCGIWHYLTGSFKCDESSKEWQVWEQKMVNFYRSNEA